MHNPLCVTIVLDIASEHAHGTVVLSQGYFEAGNQLHNQKLCISITDNGWRKPCQEIEKLVDLWQDTDTCGDHDLHKLNAILRYESEENQRVVSQTLQERISGNHLDRVESSSGRIHHLPSASIRAPRRHRIHIGG